MATPISELAPLPWRVESTGSETWIVDANGSEVALIDRQWAGPKADREMLAREIVTRTNDGGE